MNFVVSSSVHVSVNKIALWICVDVDDWTAERVIIASNAVKFILHSFCRVLTAFKEDWTYFSAIRVIFRNTIFTISVCARDFSVNTANRKATNRYIFYRASFSTTSYFLSCGSLVAEWLAVWTKYYIPVKFSLLPLLKHACGEKWLAAMLAVKRSVGVAAEVNLWEWCTSHMYK